MINGHFFLGHPEVQKYVCDQNQYSNTLAQPYPKQSLNFISNVSKKYLKFNFQLTGVPTTSPGSTGSGSNLSPSCGEGGPAVSPLSSSRTGSGMADPMNGQIFSDSSHLAALSGEKFKFKNILKSIVR